MFDSTRAWIRFSCGARLHRPRSQHLFECSIRQQQPPHLSHCPVCLCELQLIISHIHAVTWQQKERKLSILFLFPEAALLFLFFFFSTPHTTTKTTTTTTTRVNATLEISIVSRDNTINVVQKKNSRECVL